MGLISRLKTWVASEALDAADLNSEYDNILNLVNGNIESANIANNSVDAARLDLSGDTSDQITHSITTKKVVYGHADFIPATPLNIIVYADRITAGIANNNDNHGVCGVRLPIGAIVTQLDVYGDTASGANNQVSLTLKRTPQANDADETMGSVVFNDNNDSGSDASISNATIANNYRYHLELLMRADSGGTIEDSKFYTAILTYTVVNLKQTI